MWPGSSKMHIYSSPRDFLPALDFSKPKNKTDYMLAIPFADVETSSVQM